MCAEDTRKSELPSAIPNLQDFATSSGLGFTKPPPRDHRFGPSMKSILRVFSYLRHYPGLATAQFPCAVGMTVAVFVFPKATGHVIDEIIPNPGAPRRIPVLDRITLAGFLAKDGLNSLRIFINNIFEQKVIYDIRSDLYEKIQRLPLQWFDTRRTGDIMTRVVEDVTNMERVLIDGIEQGLIAVLQVVGIGIYPVFPESHGGGLGHPAGAASRDRGMDLFDTRPRPLPQPARRHLRFERPPARQHFRRPPDQGLRRGTRRARALQPLFRYPAGSAHCG